MRYSFAFALELALVLALTAASPGTLAARASGNVSATIITPANIAGPIGPVTSGVFVGSVTGNLAILVPGAVSSLGNGDSRNSALPVLYRRLKSGCARCSGQAKENGMLEGDPVNHLIFTTTSGAHPAKGRINVTVVYD